VREGWEKELTARARAYWTEARTRELAGDKQLLLPPAEAAPLLRAIGLIRADASMPPPQVRKYFQCNQMVKLLEPAMRELCARRAITRIVDAGCGRSYLSLLLAWVYRGAVEVVGVDRNAKIIDECRRRTEIAGLDDVVRFEVGGIDELSAEPHAVISLHACDTATCDAIALGVARGADLIAVAPCCQAELARGWAALAHGGLGTASAEREPPGVSPRSRREPASPGANNDGTGAFGPIWRAPHLRRETAADIHRRDARAAAPGRGLRGERDRVRAVAAHAEEHPHQGDATRRAGPRGARRIRGIARGYGGRRTYARLTARIDRAR
jgi:SAM-dependent methyltransferase